MPEGTEKKPLELAYSDYGAKDAPAIFLLIGLGLPGAAWPQPMIRELTGAGYRVVVPDNRDSGKSPRCPEAAVTASQVFESALAAYAGKRVSAGYDVADMARDTLALADRLGIGAFHAVGFSMGGMIAQELALAAPERIATLSLFSTASGNIATGRGRLDVLVRLWMRPAPEGGDAEDYARHSLTMVAGPKYPTTEEEIQEGVKLAPLMSDKNAVYRQMMAILAAGNRSPRLPQIRARTVVVHGIADRLLPFKAGRELAERIPGARLVPIEGLGHQLPPELWIPHARLIAAHCRDQQR